MRMFGWFLLALFCFELSSPSSARASDFCLNLFSDTTNSTSNPSDRVSTEEDGPRVTLKTRKAIAAAINNPPANAPSIVADRLYRRAGVRAEPSRLATANPKQLPLPAKDRYDLNKIRRLLRELAPNLISKDFG